MFFYSFLNLILWWLDDLDTTIKYSLFSGRIPEAVLSTKSDGAELFENHFTVGFQFLTDLSYLKDSGNLVGTS